MVYFIGAGPGDPELLTIKGKKLLCQADTVIYAGSLVNPELMSCCRKDARILDSSRMDLEEIIRAVRETEPGMTVRLQTGDTSLFSAIHEQTDRLRELGIRYETVPGVSSFCAAAAAMDMEYTVPGRAQSVIITRAAGRTPVPERESIRNMASIGTSMVIFLSAGKTEEVSRDLIAGGYDPDTPARIVYRASWPDQKVIECTVGTLHQAAEESGIFRTALLIVGDFLRGSTQRSRLYDSSFTTGYRTGKEDAESGPGAFAADSPGRGRAPLPGAGPRRQVHACAFTDRGFELGKGLGFDSLTRISRSRGTVTLKEWTAGHIRQGNTLVFIGAVQIAVRAMNGLMRGKADDPAVLVIDEGGHYVVPVLSGHLGGANGMAVLLSRRLKEAGFEGTPVITTASDGRHVFAVDSWAAEHGMKVKNPEKIVSVTSAVLEGKKVTGGVPEDMWPEGADFPADIWPEGADFPEDICPEGTDFHVDLRQKYAGYPHVNLRQKYADYPGPRVPDGEKCGQIVWERGYREGQHFQIRFRRPRAGENCLVLVPRIVTLGIGCRRGTPAETILAAIRTYLEETGIYPEAVSGLASIDLKRDEAGLAEAAKALDLPVSFYSADMLQKAEGDFTPSEFVKKTTGVDNVCERAAVTGSGNGILIGRKEIFRHVTLAAAGKATWTRQKSGIQSGDPRYL